MVAVRFTILGSGSSGNSAYIETDQTRLLIDAGFSAKQIRARLATLGRTPEMLQGILVTHEHSDHIQGLGMLCERLGVPIYCNRFTKEAIEARFERRFECRIFETGNSFEVGDVRVDTFSLPHDAQDPVGFLLHTDGGQIGFLTDLGHATKLVIERVRRSNLLVLEANHDMKLLQDDHRRPWSVKQRILSRHGHLSNEAAAAALAQIVTAELTNVFLGHLSGDCNRPELARQTVLQEVERIGAQHVALHVASQEKPCPTVEMAASPMCLRAEKGDVHRVVVKDDPKVQNPQLQLFEEWTA